MGTALGVIYAAKERGKKLTVTIGETRPLLQGARLSSWELIQKKIGVTLICDSMVAAVMNQKRIDKVIVGADRIAANGDTANKIGTYSIACLAAAHNIPFYVAAPSSTFDFSIPDGRHIPIEERKPEEVTEHFGLRHAPHGVKVFNPAFDVTPAKLITGIITERGVARAPYKKTLKGMFMGTLSVFLFFVGLFTSPIFAQQTRSNAEEIQVLSALYEQADFYEKAGRYDKAEEALKVVEEGQSSKILGPYFELMHADILKSQGKKEEAAKIYTMLLEKHADEQGIVQSAQSRLIQLSIQ